MGKEIKILFLLLLLFSFSLVSADYLTHQVDKDLEFSFTSNNATQCNITSINTPNGRVAIGLETTRDGQDFYGSISGGNFSSMGDYCFNIVCSDGVNYETGNFCRSVNYTGQKLEMPQTIMYIVVLFFLIGLLIYLLYIYPSLPQNEVNDDGYVISVSQLTYLRPIAIGFMWLILMAITFIVSNISIAYIQAGFLGNFLFGIWTIMMYSNIVILPLWVIWIITTALRQAKLKEFFERGGMNFQ